MCTHKGTKTSNTGPLYEQVYLLLDIINVCVADSFGVLISCRQVYSTDVSEEFIISIFSEI